MRFTVLGTVAIVEGDEHHSVARAQTRGVLALLVLNAGRVLSQSSVIEALWGGAAPSTARNQIQTSVHAIRRKLADLDAAETVLGGAAGYRLVAEPDQIDASVFDDLVRLARDVATNEPEEAVRLLRQALAMWHGEPLAGAAGAFVPAARARLVDRQLAAVEALADTELRLGRHAELVDELASLVDTHPMRETLRARLMTALYRTGRQLEALDTYRAYRGLLADQAGLDPGAALAELAVAILRHDARLADGPVVAPVEPAVSRLTPAQLPADVPDFTGREPHLRRLDGFVPISAGDPPAVVAIAGAAGVGKTALAVHWAHRVSDRFPDGQLYVNLAGYAPGPPVPPVAALARFLRALGVPDELIPVDVEEAAATFRSALAGRRMLLLLDNARGADQVRPLLPGSPGCLAVVTSRDDLVGLAAREGARRLDLDVLSPDEASSLLGRLLGTDRVATEPAAAGELARLCGYLPLALRIAAANLSSQAGQTIAAYTAKLRTGDRLGALAVPGDDTVAVRAAFELSYVDLLAPVRRMFRLLGIAPGVDCTAETAAALGGLPVAESARLLRTLADAHLIDESAPGRYQFHDLLRLYAADRALAEEDAAERDTAIDRLYAYYVSTVDATARVLYPHVIRLPSAVEHPVPGFEDHTKASEWLDGERPNLVAAVAYAAEHGPPERAWLLADGLRGYFQLCMRTVDWLAVAQTGLAAADAAGDRRAQAAAHLSLAALHWRQGRHDKSIDHHGRALTQAQRSGWADGEAAALGNLGAVYNMTGRLAEAADHYAEALALNRRLGALGGQAVNLGNLGGVYSELGRLAEAADHHGQSLALYRKIGSRSGEALALSNLAETLHGLGRLVEAERHLVESLTLRREVGDRGGEADTLTMLAVVQRDSGRPAESRQLAEAALALAREIGHQRLAANALNTLGTIHLRLGDGRRAVDLHGAALREIGDTTGRYADVEAHLGIARAEHLLGDPDAAGRTALRALGLARTAGYRVLEGQALTTLAEVSLDSGSLDRAATLGEEALASHRDTGHLMGAAQAHAVLGRVHRQAGLLTAARAHWREAVRLYEEIGTTDADEVRTLLG